MKNVVKNLIITSLLTLTANVLHAQLFYSDSHLFTGQKPLQWAAVGDCPGYYVGTDFGIEFYEAGLNVWKPNGTYMFGNYKLFLDSIGRFGIGRKPTFYKLEVDGQVWTTGGLLITSDNALKRNIRNLADIGSYASNLFKLNPKIYEKQIKSSAGNQAEIEAMVSTGKIPKKEAEQALIAMNEFNKDEYKTEIGFIAQEVKELFPDIVESDKEGLLSVNYIGLIPIMVETIKEMKNKIDVLESDLRTRLVAATTDNVLLDDTEEYVSQNVPNPIEGTTIIKYRLPEGAQQSMLTVYSANGMVVKSILLDSKDTSGSVMLSASEFHQGTFIYKLSVNGIVLGVKKMTK